MEIHIHGKIIFILKRYEGWDPSYNKDVLSEYKSNYKDNMVSWSLFIIVRPFLEDSLILRRSWSLYLNGLYVASVSMLIASEGQTLRCVTTMMFHNWLAF